MSSEIAPGKFFTFLQGILVNLRHGGQDFQEMFPNANHHLFRRVSITHHFLLIVSKTKGVVLPFETQRFSSQYKEAHPLRFFVVKFLL
jgi:hypothetical protein